MLVLNLCRREMNPAPCCCFNMFIIIIIITIVLFLMMKRPQQPVCVQIKNLTVEIFIYFLYVHKPAQSCLLVGNC